MRLSNALTLPFVASAMYVSVFITAQDAAATNHRFFGLGRGIDGEFGLFANQTLLLEITPDPFGAVQVGTTQDVPLNGLAFQPGTGTLYVSSALKGTDGLNGGPGFRSLYTMDPVTAETTLVGSFGFGTIEDDSANFVRSLTFGADGTLYGTYVEQLYSIDITTGLATAVGGPYTDGGPFLGKPEANMEGIAIDPTSDTLYGISWDDMELFTIDKATGAATSLGAYPSVDEVTRSLAGIAIDSEGIIYASAGNQLTQIFSLDKSDFTTHVELGAVNDFIGREIFDGSVSAITFELALAGPAADFDLDGDVDGADFLLWQQGFGTTYTATDLANWEDEYGTVVVANVVASAVPEPSAVVLLMLGAIGWVSLKKARHNSAYGKI